MVACSPGNNGCRVFSLPVWELKFGSLGGQGRAPGQIATKKAKHEMPDYQERVRIVDGPAKDHRAEGKSARASIDSRNASTGPLGYTRMGIRTHRLFPPSLPDLATPYSRSESQPEN